MHDLVKLFKQLGIEPGFYLDQCMSGGLVELDPFMRKDPSKLVLDSVKVDVARAVDMERLRYDMFEFQSPTGETEYFHFSKEAFQIIQDPVFMQANCLIKDWEKLGKSKIKRYTMAKWMEHMEVILGRSTKPLKEGEKANSYLAEEIEGWAENQIFAWSTYFGVPKSDTEARSIVNAKSTNELFLRPWAINLCEPTRVLRVLEKELGAKRAKMVQAGGDGKIWVVSMDWRHYYHQLETGSFQQRFFGIAYRDEKQRKKYCKWLSVPMGWSWAPHVAQCLGWHFIAHQNKMFGKIDRNMKAPPQYLRTSDRDGVAFLYVDNVHAYFLSEAKAQEFMKQVGANMAKYNVQLKYATLDGKGMALKTTFEKKKEVTIRGEFPIVKEVTLEREPKQDCTPGALGMEFKNEGGHFYARLDDSKMQKLPKKLDREKVRAPRTVTSLLGKVLYRRHLFSRPQTRSADAIMLLSKAGKFVSKDRKKWDDPSFGDLLEDPKDWKVLEESLKELRTNDWIRSDFESQNKDLEIAASDASGTKWGWVHYGSTTHSEFPKAYKKELNHLERVASLTTDQGEFDADVWLPRHIYLKEMRAAELAIEGILSGNRRNVEIVLAVDNSATRIALNRGLSINKVAAEMLVRIHALLEAANSTLLAVAIPGHYNVADYPSRNKIIEEKKRGAPPKEGMMKDFNPITRTWEVIRDAYNGRIDHLKPQERQKLPDGTYAPEPEDEMWGAVVDYDPEEGTSPLDYDAVFCGKLHVAHSSEEESAALEKKLDRQARAAEVEHEKARTKAQGKSPVEVASAGNKRASSGARPASRERKKKKM